MLVHGVDNGVSDSIVVGVDELDFGIKGRVDSFLAFILVLLLFPTILASVLVLISCRLLLKFFQLLSQAAILFKPPGIVNASIYSNASQYSGTMKA